MGPGEGYDGTETEVWKEVTKWREPWEDLKEAASCDCVSRVAVDVDQQIHRPSAHCPDGYF